MKSEREIDNLKKHARVIVKEVFKQHGMDPHRKIGLQVSLQDEIVKAALKGEIDIKYNASLNKK